MAGARADRGTLVGLVDGWHDIVEPSCKTHGPAAHLTRGELAARYREATTSR